MTIRINSFYFLILMIISFNSCSEIKTDNAIECYRNWSGAEPTSDIKVLNGKYWQSPHLTKEYIMYMELETTSQWLNEFIKQNYLSTDTTKWDSPDDTPAWFLPTKEFQTWSSGEEYDRSRFFIDTVNKRIFIYEIQL